MAKFRELKEQIVISRLENDESSKKKGKNPDLELHYGKKRVLKPLRPQTAQTERLQTPANGFELDGLLQTLDATFVSEWLVTAAEKLKDIQAFWQASPNSIQFAHFWLSDFDDDKRNEMLLLEYGLLKETLKFAFQTMSVLSSSLDGEISVLLRAVLHEYPRVFGGDGTGFLDLVRTLGESNLPSGAGEYKALLSLIKSSTTNPQYGQWLLAIRCFSLMEIASASISFYTKMSSEGFSLETQKHLDMRLSSVRVAPQHAPSISEKSLPDTMPLSSRPMTMGAFVAGSPYINEMFLAAKFDYDDVVYYILSRHLAPFEATDGLGRTLVFVAVLHRCHRVLQFLVENASSIQVNLPASSGNTPLHTAVANDDPVSVRMLMEAGADPNVPNPESNNATPMEVAQIYERKELVHLMETVKPNQEYFWHADPPPRHASPSSSSSNGPEVWQSS